MIFAIDPSVSLGLITAGSVVGAAVVAGPVMWYLKRFDSRNTDQHYDNKSELVEIKQSVQNIDAKLDTHIAWHLHDDPRPDAQVIVLHPQEQK